MNTPKTKGTPEFQAACTEYFSLKRNGLGSSPEALAARQRMIDHAPDEVVHLLLEKAKQAGLVPADMPIRAVDPYVAKVASIEAIAKAMRKGGAT